MTEFTGERVIPGQVEADLWNEHLSRYLFAARLCRERKVLDVGCGTGYGTFELAQTAASATGIDIAADAIEYARERYAAPNIVFQTAAAEELPFDVATFDAVVCFEVIEHLTEPARLLAEAARVLAPGGQLIVSTPNVRYYAETRERTGPNPFHHHEFTLDEFRAALLKHFSSVLLFTQNHSPGIVFEPVEPTPSVPLARVEKANADIEGSHFYLAVCSQSPQTGAPTFVYVPQTSNVLRERELHIQRLEGELGTKDRWLSEALQKHEALVAEFRRQNERLAESNEWARSVQRQIDEKSARIAALQAELAAAQDRALDNTRRLEVELAAAHAEGEANSLRLESELAEMREAWDTLSKQHEIGADDLAACVRLLHEAETTIEERTTWAQSLDMQRERLEAHLATLAARISGFEASRWTRLGRSFGLGPKA